MDGSYITGRHQAVLIDDFVSTLTPLLFGVAQGSVLWPIVFILYTIPLYKLVRAFGIDCHFFSDDSQIYKIFRILRDRLLLGISQEEACCLLAACIRAIKGWAVENWMMLNVGKTDALTVSAVRSMNASVPRSIAPASVIDVSGELITSSSFVRNLGIYFD